MSKEKEFPICSSDSIVKKQLLIWSGKISEELSFFQKLPASKGLKPIVNAIELVSDSQYPTIGLSYFVLVHIQEFLEDNDNDSKILYYLESLLLKQFQRYFFDNYAQLKIMKLHSCFDPIGFGCLTRREQRQCESSIVELNEQLADVEVVDGIDFIDQAQSQTNSEQKVHSSKPSVMANFINSIGKTFVIVSSAVSTFNKKKLMEEISLYRSLAQQEYNNIIHDKKSSNTIDFWNLSRIQLKSLYKLATYHLVTPVTYVASESAFSTASYLLRKQRSRLTPANLCSSMFLKDKIDN